MQPQPAETPPNDTERSALEGMTLRELTVKRVELLNRIAHNEFLLKNLDTEMARRIDIPAVYDRNDKTYGEISEVIDGVRFRFKIDKRVKYDSDGLIGVAKTMPWETASSMFKIEFSMSEKEYLVLQGRAATSDTARAVLEQVNQARTVKFSDPRIIATEDPDA